MKHSSSPVNLWPLDGTVLKESVYLVILGMTFDAKIAFETFGADKHHTLFPMLQLRG